MVNCFSASPERIKRAAQEIGLEQETRQWKISARPGKCIRVDYLARGEADLTGINESEQPEIDKKVNQGRTEKESKSTRTKKHRWKL